MQELLDSDTDIIIDDEEQLANDNGFPNNLILIEVTPGKYAANNGTTPGPDPMNVDGIACFETRESARIYMDSERGISGEMVDKTFAEAREIALSKAPKINGLLFMVGARIAAIHYTG